MGRVSVRRRLADPQFCNLRCISQMLIPALVLSFSRIRIRHRGLRHRDNPHPPNDRRPP